MPLRPLHRETGKPKSDKELSQDEVAGRIAEEEEDRRLFATRGSRIAAEQAAVELYRQSLERPAKR